MSKYNVGDRLKLRWAGGHRETVKILHVIENTGGFGGYAIARHPNYFNGIKEVPVNIPPWTSYMTTGHEHSKHWFPTTRELDELVTAINPPQLSTWLLRALQTLRTFTNPPKKPSDSERSSESSKSPSSPQGNKGGK